MRSEDKATPDALPEGWTEAYPGGMATRNHPTLGGIIDKTIVGGRWFVVFHHDDLQPVEDLDSRAEAFAAFFAAIERIEQ
ncbi:hypothetical protein SAMN05216370_0140 [Pseudomonas peli]|uniref:Uncharacterized protein n=1 Tax=Pseudomonas peli TaxID=592361 RepID=A0AB37ZDH6_9PSED|nr:hypothetical protein [Pseudomonas peli]NMZ71374.1 hypothetical protein [Pseudomonas peli]SCW90361.1 hypothetical protein SAMN05216370_0140 [Pseudomonas peli]